SAFRNDAESLSLADGSLAFGFLGFIFSTPSISTHPRVLNPFLWLGKLALGHRLTLAWQVDLVDSSPHIKLHIVNTRQDCYELRLISGIFQHLKNTVAYGIQDLHP